MIWKLLLLLIVIFIAQRLEFPDRETSLQTTAVAPSAARSVTPAPANLPSPGWEYFEPTDTISGKRYKVARVRSENSLSLGFPYGGVNYGTLTVRQHPQYGLDVSVSVDKGQILCHGESYGECVHQIRFDEGKVERFTVRSAADGSSTIVFSAYPKWAVRELRKAKRVFVQLLMHDEGNQVLIFNTDPHLDW